MAEKQSLSSIFLEHLSIYFEDEEKSKIFSFSRAAGEARLHIEQIIAIALIMQSDRNDGSLDGNYMSEAVMKNKNGPKIEPRTRSIRRGNLNHCTSIACQKYFETFTKKFFFVS